MCSKVFRGVLVLAVAFGLLACGDDAGSGGGAAVTPAVRKAPAPRAAAKAPVKAKAEESGATSGEPGDATENGDTENDDTESYVAEGKRDPFRSFHFKNPKEPVVATGPLSDFDLVQLSVVGVVWNTTNPRALVADPAGRSFVLKEGASIGKNSGRVIRIMDDMILVKEKFVDFEGTVSTKDVEMRIEKSHGG